MFFKKNERRTHSACVILTVGALAAVGAITIMKCGREMASDVFCKVKSLFKSERAQCPAKSESEQ